MKRTNERCIWASAVVLLLVIGGVLFAGPVRMMGMCGEMMHDGTMQDGTTRPGAPP